MGSSSSSMSDDLLERGYIEAWVLALVFGAVEEFRAGRIGTGIACSLLSLVGQIIVIKWRKIKERMGPRFAATADAAVHDFRTWIGTVALFLVVVILSPFVEQGRLPFSNSATSVPAVLSFSDASLKQIYHQPFKNETVDLDGFDYVDCTFDNVTFRYNGTAPSRMTDSHFINMKEGSVIRVESKNPIVKNTIVIMATIFSVAGGKIAVGGDGAATMHNGP